MKRRIILMILLGVAFSGCYYDTEEQLYPATGPCETNGVTFNSTILPLLQANGCLGCHSGGALSGNISLEGYNNVKIVALNGKLYGAISHSAGFSPMPQGGNKMNNCNINKIKAWIDAGANNN